MNFKKFISESAGPAKFVTIFEKGKLSNFRKSIMPHLAEVYNEDAFTNSIYEHISEDDLDEALGHLFKDANFEVGGIGPKVVFLRCEREDINMIIHY